MTNIVRVLAAVAALAAGTAAIGGPALASPDSPFYPDQFKNPNLPYPSVGVGSGIPSQYRLGN